MPYSRTAGRRSPGAGRRRRGQAVTSGRALARRTRGAAAGTILAGSLLAGTALWSAGAAAASPAAGQVGAAPAAIAITSVSPQFATPRATVTVSGQVTNTSLAPISGLLIQLRWSSQELASRDELQQYAHGLIADYPVPGAIRRLRRPLAPGTAVRWSISVPVRKLDLTRFGVYPLAAQAESRATGADLATSRTFLPYWPARHGGYQRPDRLNISWLWPLIDSPDQAACPGLLTNGLAASMAPGGRLSGLLDAGAAHAGAAALTWVIDPALLSNAATMTAAYSAGANADCAHAHHLPASRAAAAWLAKLRKATAGRPVMVTPYADVDVAALARQNLNQDLARAFRLGRSVASAILGRDFSASPTTASGRAAALNLSGFAWPAGGIANYSVLMNLAVNGITTVVLNSKTMPPVTPQVFTPSAVTSTPDGETGDMHVLLYDQVLAQIVGSAKAASGPGAAFAVRQRFLAETAMIAAEAPNTQRAVVVAPPRHWDPPPGLAGGLLAETAAAPWLRTVGLGRLAAATSKAGQVPRLAPDSRSSAALGNRLLVKVRGLDRRVQLLQSILVRPNAALDAAVPAIESSAWRGGRWPVGHAWALLKRVSQYVTSQLGGISIIPARSDTLGGQRGTIPVSISSKLSYPVRIRLAVKLPVGSRLAVTSGPGVIVAYPNQVTNVKLKVHATGIGATIVSLRLLTKDRKQLPGPAAHMTIQSSRFGTVTLIIIAAALGVFTISSATRAIRRGRGAQRDRPDTAGSPGPADTGAAAGTGATGASPGTARTIGGNEQFAGADSVVPSHADRQRPGRQQAPGASADTSAPGTEPGRGADPAAGPEHDRTKEADDYASAPGWSDRG
jgi:Family of unknown function (DUF6049)